MSGLGLRKHRRSVALWACTYCQAPPRQLLPLIAAYCVIGPLIARVVWWHDQEHQPLAEGGLGSPDLGVETYTHDRFHGLVADATTHGYRLVGSAMRLRSIERKLAKRHRAASKL